MRKYELVKMWIAQGYLKETSGADMEAVGEQYFQVLAARSFFQDFKTYDQEDMRFKMHDIVHDFAQYMTKNECLTVNVNNLRGATMETSIERFESLPETLCDLCNLQSLDVTWCDSLKELPNAIGKLIKLRHLWIYGSGVAFIPKGIERITCLRTLDVFTMCGGGNESKAANLRELKNLNHIGGSLKIWNLRGGVEDASDAAEAQLKNKKRLRCLLLAFDYSRQNDILIEALRPPSDLENLTISRYGGLHLPNWMMTLTRLQELKLCYCANLEVLPPLGRLPNLEGLVLRSLKVRRLDAGILGIEKDENASINEGEIARVTAFPKLKELEIWYLEEAEEWDGIGRRVGEEDANTTSIISIMPQLRDLIIENCPLLRALPDYVLAAPLRELDISRCPILTNRYGEEEMAVIYLSHILHYFAIAILVQIKRIIWIQISFGLEDTEELLQSGFRYSPACPQLYQASVNVLYWSGYGLDFDMEYMYPVAVSTEKEEEEGDKYVLGYLVAQ
ncbi:putative disease resistance RPP13-like protein 1 [Populus nigra]|uniref:putative disease resistance RPP13-like protein 1 n=1 Tax=Populus nigra TaxID=3691 RepID=UPI002B26E333|nr:putative disease resistance RPP13-like protein 1 [Populus nigra]